MMTAENGLQVRRLKVEGWKLQIFFLVSLVSPPPHKLVRLQVALWQLLKVSIPLG